MELNFKWGSKDVIVRKVPWSLNQEFVSSINSLSRVPLTSFCFATSGIVTGFFGDTVSASSNEIRVIPDAACWGLTEA